MLYILTNSSTSESSTAILHDLKNAVYNAYWTALFIYSASGYLSCRFYRHPPKSPPSRSSVNATQLEALRAYLPYARYTYELHAHAHAQ